MPDYTIETTEFIPSPDAGVSRQSQAETSINMSVIRPAKFVIMQDETRVNVLSLLVLPGQGITHLVAARRSESMREGKFFGAGKLRDIGKNNMTAVWGSDTCKHKDAYGYDTPQGLEEEELTAILELVKIKAVECLEGVIRGEQTS